MSIRDEIAHIKRQIQALREELEILEACAEEDTENIAPEA